MDIRILVSLLARLRQFRAHDAGRRPQLKAYQTHALYRLRRHAYGRSPFDLTRQVRTAFVASTNPWHMSTLVGAMARSWWAPELRLDAAAPLASIIEQLNAWQPEVLIASRRWRTPSWRNSVPVVSASRPSASSPAPRC